MKIVKDLVQNEIIIEKSRFITHLKRINSIDEANEFIKEIKKKYYDATHNCVALVLDGNARSSDDGEPSGTAGVPILEALKKNDLTDTICIVTRYFGGIKLGAGGLIRAYSKSANEAIKKASFIEKRILEEYMLSYDYSSIAKIDKILRKYTIIINTEYNEIVTSKFLILDNKDALITELNDALKGKLSLEYISNVSYDISI